jgi:hypothetical protein
MYNGGKIIAGLVLFFGLILYPFYSNMFGGPVKRAMPSIDTPVISQLDKTECVRPGEVMRTDHMKILDDWRDEVVRNGKRDIIHVGGRIFEKSLQNGCMMCHSNKKQFCGECHGYAGVKPYCWDCHFVPDDLREEGQL